MTHGDEDVVVVDDVQSRLNLRVGDRIRLYVDDDHLTLGFGDDIPWKRRNGYSYLVYHLCTQEWVAGTRGVVLY